MIYVLTGDGKGKTTSAIGMGIRAVGAGKKVLMVQFLKSGGYCEDKTIEDVNNFDLQSFGQTCFVVPEQVLLENPKLKKQGVRAISEKDFVLAQQGFALAEEAITSGQYNFLILDEINIALKYKLLDQKKVISFLRKYGQKSDVVLTGRYAPKEIIKLADLVTEMKPIKHPYQKGIQQRRGVEF
ncbi:MAG: cob(I)yrinic acid a,c-diamide adenosyltransferase [Candidatus Pacebacteria bacterium]|nr:cob(I)yrinic acid a,c-diamide adenosyltransferase [Candidatus Paceibacterota bacterium]